MRGYSILGFLSLLMDFFYSRLFFKGVRLVRRPIRIRGKKYIDFGKGLTTGVGCRIDAFESKVNNNKVKINFGDNVQINDYVHIGAVESVSIGNNVLIASKVFISDHNHGKYSGSGQSSPYIAPAERELSSAAVVIEDDVWIGEFVSVLPGVTIGRGSIIGTHSVVNKDVPPYSISVGAPSRVVKYFDSSKGEWVAC
jgi:acetyltransferase-like isoleucine patch superfamily enzyme